ncbi:ATP-dependent RecD-like DNA helicase [bioreactor metagenome]|uniref:ATP-dependent RecD-like DNA helicase n=1 Tax=bioreactor metagenome TaxID=1076179 RepID=A0A644T5Y1_9ZZZZ|nr:AAA family ATPase [Candidatus Elulimicrobiales bacterium]
MTQKEALDILKMGHSVFLTGAAGTGKTYILNKYIEYLKSHSITPAITASTGIAATHIAGQTIHSWSGIGVYEKLDSWTLDKLEQNEKLFKRYENVKVLIIDEISMLHASRLDMVNTLFKKLKYSDKPFAGIQIIFCGDFFQLPPVVKRYGKVEDFPDESHEFAFNSKAWQELNPVICYLKENYRQQEDATLNKILNDIRFERETEKILVKLNNQITEKTETEILKLYTHNIDVDTINYEKYCALETNLPEFSYETISDGKKNFVEILKQNCLAPEILNLKKGTKVIFVKNDKNREYQNGTLGEIIDFDVSNMPIVKTFDGRKISVSRESWQYANDDGKILAEISQLPLRYAWAITVHKSQGMTLDAAEIDLSKAFGSGMGYVALSRVRKIENISLLGIHERALKINKEVIRQDKIFRAKSERASQALDKYYIDKEMKIKLKRKQEEFLLACDGTLETIEIKEEVFEKKEKVKTTMITLNFIKEKILPEKIAKERKLTLGTIVSHIEELFEGKEINEKDIKYILKDLEKKYNKEEVKIINKILKQDTGLTIKHRTLNNKNGINIDFQTLRLFRLFI